MLYKRIRENNIYMTNLKYAWNYTYKEQKVWVKPLL